MQAPPPNEQLVCQTEVRRPVRGQSSAGDKAAKDLNALLAGRPIVFVGIMGAGKSAIGRRLAERLGLPFVDADNEIEAAANLTIPEMFEIHGEAYFRDGERRVISRLMSSGPQVLSTGGGAFMDDETRARIKKDAISVWLFADIGILMDRGRRKSNRPLLKAKDPEAVMKDLLETRNPVYAEADVHVESRDGPHDIVVDDVVNAIGAHLSQHADAD